MSKLLKNCTKCCTKKAMDCFGNRKDSIDGKRNQCKDCRTNENKIWKIANKEKVKVSDKKYRLKNILQINKKRTLSYSKYYKNQWRIKYPEKYNSYHLKYERLFREDLGNEYISRLLCEQGFKRKDLTPELIETKKLIIKTKRLCKTLQN